MLNYIYAIWLLFTQDSMERKKLLCKHEVFIDDVGGAGIQCCKKCHWTGRVTYDFFATSEEAAEIKKKNQELGILK